MPTITLKNIPDPLYEQLKAAASTHRRSLNSEVLYWLEQALGAKPVDVAERIEAARLLREKSVHYRITDEELDSFKRSGRP